MKALLRTPSEEPIRSWDEYHRILELYNKYYGEDAEDDLSYIEWLSTGIGPLLYEAGVSGKPEKALQDLFGVDIPNALKFRLKEWLNKNK